ncbi:MAG TPA: hypothetical protein VHT94_06735 [Streptosporangiaceae bacterium]|jgi:hypothetical protein|nr:hypothetical protein [Streptosporangiaceae bacterium]
MQTTTKTNRKFWITPAVGVAGGLVYLIAFSLGGHPGYGLAGLGVMVVFSAAIALAGLRSETVRGLLDHRDERLAGIDLRATAVTAVVMILAVLTGFVIEVARGQTGWPYALIGAIGGVAYLGAVGYFRVRG